MWLSVDGDFYIFEKMWTSMFLCYRALDIEGHYWLPQKKYIARKTIGTI